MKCAGVLLAGLAAALQMTSASAQLLDNGYQVTPFATVSRGNTFGDDLHIVDMNDFGQLMVVSGLTIGQGALVDTNKRIPFNAPAQFSLPSGDIVSSGGATWIGVSNIGMLAHRSVSFPQSGFPGFDFIGSLAPVLRQFPCVPGFRCSFQDFIVGTATEFANDTSVTDLSSINQITNDIVLATNSSSEIFVVSVRPATL